MKLIIDIDEKLVCEGFERHFTEEERDILIRAIGNDISISNEEDLISRSDLKQTINKIVDEEIGVDEKWAKGLKYSLKIIDNALAIPVDTCINYKVCTLRKQEELISAIEDCED